MFVARTCIMADTTRVPIHEQARLQATLNFTISYVTSLQTSSS